MHISIENDPTFVHEVNWIQVVRVIRLLCSSSEKDIECFVKGRILPDSKELINKNILKPLFKHAEASSMEGIGRITEILYIYYKEKLGEFIPFISGARGWAIPAPGRQIGRASCRERV